MTTRRSRAARTRSLKRNVGFRRPKKTIVVFCEGVKTEPIYINALKQQPSVHDVAAVDIRVETGHGGSVPLTLVSMAADARRRAIDEDGEIDEFWCIFDVEWPRNHPNLDSALEAARSNDIRLAISNPCFEVWLILHFQDQSGWLDNDDACRLRGRLDGSLGKGLEPEMYMPLRFAAAIRAAALEKRHEENGTDFPHDNPSSGMYRFLCSVEPSKSQGMGGNRE